jgi:hypothetical protein
MKNGDGGMSLMVFAPNGKNVTRHTSESSNKEMEAPVDVHEGKE